MRLIEFVARKNIDALNENGVRLRVLGRTHELPPSLREALLLRVERLSPLAQRLLRRTASLNTSPTFIRLLEALARERL